MCKPVGATVKDGLSLFCNRNITVNKYTYICTLLGDCIDNRPDYEKKDVGYDICRNLKMTLYSQINPTSHLKFHIHDVLPH